MGLAQVMRGGVTRSDAEGFWPLPSFRSGARPQYEERKRFADTERPPGRKVEVTFPASNNLSIFVVFAAVRHIRDIAPAGRQGLSA